MEFEGKCCPVGRKRSSRCGVKASDFNAKLLRAAETFKFDYFTEVILHYSLPLVQIK